MMKVRSAGDELDTAGGFPTEESGKALKHPPAPVMNLRTSMTPHPGLAGADEFGAGGEHRMRESLEKICARAAGARTGLARQQVVCAEFMRKERGLPRGGRAPTAQASGDVGAIKTACIRAEIHPGGCKDDAAEIFTIVVKRETFVPRSDGVRQVAWHEPGGRRHHATTREIEGEPVDRREVAPILFGVENGGRRGGFKTPPRACGERAFGSCLKVGELACDFVGVEEIVGIQELDELTAGQAERVITCGAGTGV